MRFASKIIILVAGEAVVKRDLDCSKFSEIARYLLWHAHSASKSLSSVLHDVAVVDE